jgi:hypothetical protein
MAMSRSRRLTAAALGALGLTACTALAVTACTSTPPSGTTGSAAASAAVPTTGAASGSAASGSAASGGGTSAGPACTAPGSYLTAIRTGQQPGADRVVFEFSGQLPASYTVTPVTGIAADGSGKPVTIAGRSLLRVTFRGATAVCAATGRTTYAGPSSLKPGFAQLVDLEAAGDFEGYLTWGVGLAAKGGYHAYTLTAPYRVVIDLSR